MNHIVQEFGLAGGAKGLVVSLCGSGVVNLVARFNSGFQFAPHEVYEVPHVMEHLLANSSKKYSKVNELHIELMKNGAYANASTSSVANAYVTEFAAFELDRIMDLVEEQLADPLIEQQQLTADIGNVREELSRNITQHASVCAIQIGEAAFPELIMNYEKRISQLPEITVAKARDHYVQTHTAGNARFFVAGDFDDGGTAIAKRLDRIAARLPKGERLTPRRAIGLNIPEPIVTQRDIAQIYYQVQMYFGELDMAERRALWLWRMIETGGFGSRILGPARAKGWAYHVGGYTQSEPGKSLFGVQGFVTPGNAGSLFGLIAQELAAVREHPVSQSELEAAKDLLVGSIRRTMQTAGDYLDWYLPLYEENGEILDFEQTLSAVRSVRAGEIQAVAQKAAASGRSGISFVGPVDDKLAGEYAAILAPIQNK